MPKKHHEYLNIVNIVSMTLIHLKPRWERSPESFLAMIIQLSNFDKEPASQSRIYQIGEALIAQYKIDLAPYKDLENLIKDGKPDHSHLAGKHKDLKLIYERLSLASTINS